MVSTHPMFGPDSGRHGWQGLPCVYDQVYIYSARRAGRRRLPRRCERRLGTTLLCCEQVRVADYHRAARALALFEDEGCRMAKLSCGALDGCRLSGPVMC